MGSLRYEDKINLEKAFEMHKGYVLNFCDRTFQEFIDSIFNFNVHIKYKGSKANKMREIWKNEGNIKIIQLLHEISNIYFKDKHFKDKPELKIHYDNIQDIIKHLKEKDINIVININNNVINYIDLPEFIKAAQKDLQDNNFLEVITKARTILEITFKEICNINKLDYVDDNLIKAFNIIRTHFKMDRNSNNYPECIKGLISASVAIVNNIANARNIMSTAHAPKYKPKKHHAQFVLEQSISLMNFITAISELNIK